ncbi:hypothetical protein B0H10DRAFT_2298332 [Mycena sp. CBHHK59/15]|nr:hypothetical protein B0H10DRAFT_2298332 [Mycena sp. CBHHK59/15]
MPSPPASRSSSRASSNIGGGDAGDYLPPSPRREVRYHRYLNGQFFDDPDTPPPPRVHAEADDFSPYTDRLDFDLADLLYRHVQMPAGAIDELMQNWAARPESAGDPPFADHDDLYNTIDATEVGHVPWQSFDVTYNQPIPAGDTTPWKTKPYTVHFRDPREVVKNQLANPDFKSEMDLAPKQVFAADGTREYEDFMSGNWAWRQADLIAEDPATHGATYVPLIFGSDKTTVSVATGQNEYYPFYMSNGLIHNNVRRAHRNGVTLIGFLSIAKTDRENADSAEFRTFRRNLFHGSLCYILQSLLPAMTVPEVTLFADGHYRRVIYGLGPYIADYPEQVLLACTVQGWCVRCTASNKHLDGPSGRRPQAHTEALFEAFDHKTLWDDYGIIPDVLPFTWGFPQADIHELLSPDLLHQVIKGTFKDHLVTWVGEYLEQVHGKSDVKKIMADIDRRIAAVPPFPGLCRFPEGRGFKQWTGDDSKALMKRNVVGEATLIAIDAALARYHQERQIFEESGVCPNGFCLPRQHSLTHYRYLIQEFGAPNGLCSSITESKHIKAIKEPWRRSSRYEALIQMLTINDRLDKLAAARIDFVERGMLSGPSARPLLPTPDPPPQAADEDDDGGDTGERTILGEVMLAKTPTRKYPRDPHRLAAQLRLPTLPDLIRHFLYAQNNPDHAVPLRNIPLADCPDYPQSVKDAELSGFRGLLATWVLLFMSFKSEGVMYPCALVTWFSAIGDEPCPDVGMWMVEPDLDGRGQRVMDIIHIDSILRGAHLIPIYGDTFIPHHFKYSSSLDSFKAFYVNKYADHHSHEIAF